MIDQLLFLLLTHCDCFSVKPEQCDLLHAGLYSLDSSEDLDELQSCVASVGATAEVLAAEMPTDTIESDAAVQSLFQAVLQRCCSLEMYLQHYQLPVAQTEK